MPAAAARVWRRLLIRLKTPFPTVAGNRLVPFGLGRDYFRRMLDAIDGAHCTVDVEMYLWENDALGRRFIEALRRAAARGLRVRVLADGYGARHVVGRPLAVVRAAGADVRTFNPLRLPWLRRLLHRTHKKLLALDGRLAFTGGAGFSTHFSTGRGWEPAWHDRMFEVTGPLVGQLLETFDTDFVRWDPGPPGTDSATDRSSSCTPGPGDAPGVGHARGRVLRSWPDGKDFQGALLHAVRRATGRVWLATPYFLPPRRLRKALYAALDRGADVRIVVPGPAWANVVLWYAARRYYGRFLKKGARIFEYRPRFYHAKLAVVDTDCALVGSSNLDAWSWRRNAELDLQFVDRDSVEIVAGCFETDRRRCREVDLGEHRSRGLRRRLVENVVGLLDDWL